MAKIVFTANIQRHVACPDREADGATVADVPRIVFADNPRARGYILDDQGALRRHMLIFLDGEIIHDRIKLSDLVAKESTIHVYQALSGG